jgi:hypothetical protein
MSSHAEDIAWAAGWFEGEGSILLSGGCLCTRVSNTDEEIIDRFAEVLDVGTMYGPYSPYGGTEHRKKPMWVWVAREDAALDAIALMWPWLGTRRRTRASELTRIPFHVFYRVSSELLAQRAASVVPSSATAA